MIRDSITNCLELVGKSLANAEYPPAMQVILFDQRDLLKSVKQIYIMADLEARYSHQTYCDKTNNGIPFRTYYEKEFHIFCGKTAELEFHRQYLDRNPNDKVIEGPSFFAGKPDSGKDLAYAKGGPFQIKFGHGSEFKVDLEKFSVYRSKGCRLALLKSDDFYADYHPRTSRGADYLTWRRPPIPPNRSYRDWLIFEIDLCKVLNDKITSLDISLKAIRDKSYSYISWFKW